jgi:hypothetical protein
LVAELFGHDRYEANDRGSNRPAGSIIAALGIGANGTSTLGC